MVEYDVEDEAEERELDGNIEKSFEDDGRKLKEVNEQNNVDSEEEAGDVASEPKSGESSNYLQWKQKNIEELKEKIAEIKAQYPVTEGQEPKKGSKKSVSNKNAGSNGPIVRWESQRNKRQVLSHRDICDDSDSFLSSAQRPSLPLQPPLPLSLLQPRRRQVVGMVLNNCQSSQTTPPILLRLRRLHRPLPLLFLR